MLRVYVHACTTSAHVHVYVRTCARVYMCMCANVYMYLHRIKFLPASSLPGSVPPRPSCLLAGAMPSSSSDVAAPALVAPAALDAPAAAAASEVNPKVELDKASARVAQLENDLVVARAQQTFWRRKHRQSEIAALEAKHGSVADVPLSQSGDDGEGPAGDGDDAARGEAKAKAKPQAKAPGQLPVKRERRPTDGRCVACWNLGRNKTQAVPHTWGPTCTAKTKASRLASRRAEADADQDGS